MTRNITIQLININDQILAFNQIVNNSNSLQVAIKTEVTNMVHKYPTLDWKKIIIVIEES